MTSQFLAETYQTKATLYIFLDKCSLSLKDNIAGTELTWKIKSPKIRTLILLGRNRSLIGKRSALLLATSNIRIYLADCETVGDYQRTFVRLNDTQIPITVTDISQDSSDCGHVARIRSELVILSTESGCPQTG